MLKGGGGRARTTPLPGHAAAFFRMHFSSSRMVSIKRVSFQILKPNPNKKENLLTFFYFLVENNNPFENPVLIFVKSKCNFICFCPCIFSIM